MKERIIKVFNEFKEKADVNGKRLFNKDNIKKMKSIIDHAAKGCYSDDPSINWYEKIRIDRDGIPIYRSIRGTSIVESIHQKLISCFSAFDASPSFADAVLRCVRHRMNTRAGVRHCADYFSGHYEQHYIEGIQQATLEIYGFPFHPSWKSSEDWINSKEKFGLVPGKHQEFVLESIPPTIELKSKEQKYLCEQLAIKAPFLPVHTKAEQKLFTTCMSQNFNIHDILEQFARKCDGINIFPKIHSHIEKHLKSWKEYGKNMHLLQNSRADITILRENMILEKSVDIHNSEENDISDEEKEYANYASTEESDVNDEDEIQTNQDSDFENIPNDSISEENSNFAMDFKEASSGEQVHDLSQEDIIEHNNSQSHCSDSVSVDDSHNILQEPRPQPQSVPAPPGPPIIHTTSIKFLPSFNLNSTDPVNLYKVQNHQREITQSKKRSRRRCMNPHPEDSSLVCGRNDCPGSGGREHCSNKDYSKYTPAKRSRARVNNQDDDI